MNITKINTPQELNQFIFSCHATTVTYTNGEEIIFQAITARTQNAAFDILQNVAPQTGTLTAVQVKAYRGSNLVALGEWHVKKEKN